MELRRGIDPVLLAAISRRDGFHPVVLLKAAWPGGTERIHSGLGDLPWGANTYKGAGHHVRDVAGAPEAGGSAPPEAAIRIAGAVATVLGYTDAKARGGEVRIWLGAVTEPAGTVLIGQPFLAFLGRIDENDADLEARIDATVAELMVSATAGPGAKENAAHWHSDENQKAIDPSDTGMERLAFASRWRFSPPDFPGPSA
ncbi:hypothetical protein ACXN5S_16335 [Pseudoroseicyclus sp. H15]